MHMKSNHLMPAASALVLAAASTVFAQEKPYTAPAVAAAPPPASPIGQWLNVDGKLPEALAKGKLNLNARLRYEFHDQQTLTPAHAPILRTRLGFTTAPVNGFQGMLEAEHLTALGDRANYGLPGIGPAGKAVIPDPPTTELNQAWASYTKYDTTLKAGRQRLVLDNARFVGDVDWRMNQQTYDAATVQSTYFKDFTLTYGFVWDVNRVFGDVAGLPAANRDFDSESHLINLSYSGWKFAKLTAYAYLLEFDNSPANSSATFGASLAGSHLFDKEKNLKASYRAEYAFQTDYKNSALASFDSHYINFEGGLDYNIFNAGAGYEVLGGNHNGTRGFGTPLATLAKFNGWANLFLTTPTAGLRDVYGWVGVKLPGNVPLNVTYHKFDADTGGADFGQEWNVTLTHKFNANWSALTRYAYYDGKAPAGNAGQVDTSRFWVQLEFTY